MKVEGFVFIFLAIFLGISDIVYWVLSHDPTGTTALALGAGLGLLCGSYLLFTGRRFPPRPEDRGNAEITDGAGVLGHFSPQSPWPVGIGFSGALIMLGFIFGLWILVIGAIGMAITVPGLLFEYVANDARRETAERLLNS